jgi:hypothetical protein
MGCLRPGWSSPCQWILGNEVASINLRAEAERLHLSYTLRVGDGEWEDMAEIIPIVRVPPVWDQEGGRTERAKSGE